MTQNHYRKSTRLQGYDYAQEGAYFVTLCAYQRRHLFGEIVDSRVVLNDIGKLVVSTCEETAIIRNNVEVDLYVVMPNHMHGIFVINDEEKSALGVGATRRVAPTKTTLVSGSLGAIIGQFKSVATKRIRQLSDSPEHAIWQRNYYDHVIRDEADLNRIRQYILTNPARWHEDSLYH